MITDQHIHTLQRSTPVIDFLALQSASRVLQDQFMKDEQILPDFRDVIASSAGQSCAYSVFPNDFRVPFQKRKLLGIPESLFQYYNTTNVTSHMGLLPGIERVWISIDHKLFLWDYVEGQEIHSLVEQQDVITQVAVVKPKPGVFIDEISYIMIICTPVSLLLIGLSLRTDGRLGHRSHKDIEMYATDMAVPTDVEMASIVGTQGGRIFMCGSQDGCLYELYYQESESWFSKRVQLINHSVGAMQSLFPRFSFPDPQDRVISVVSDSSRNCVYTLTANNSIHIYQPLSDKTIRHVQTITDLHKSAQDKLPGSTALSSHAFQIIGLHPVEPSGSRTGLQLIVITSNGVRLYFSPSPSASHYAPMSRDMIDTLQPIQLIHVRLAPPNLLYPDEQSNLRRAVISPQSSAHPYILSGIENSCYLEGLFIAAQPGEPDGTDFLVCIAPDLARIASLGQTSQLVQTHQNSSYVGGSHQPPLVEYATLLAIPGRTWAMASVPRSYHSSSLAPPNELASQFSHLPQEFMILTNVGLTFLVKRRALDYLKAVIEEVQSEGIVQPIIDFRDSYGRDQTCAMLLGIACGNAFIDIYDHSTPGTFNTISPDTATVAKQAFYDFGERPIWAERGTYGTSDSSGTAIYSGRRQGLLLYLSRLLQPIWKVKLIKPRNLGALKDFLDKNPHLFHSSVGDRSGPRITTGKEQEAWKAEQDSVAQLEALLARTIEGIYFILTLNDYRIGELVPQFPSGIQALLASMALEDLITSVNGVTISRALANVVIEQQIAQQINVDALSDVLQERCGSFCSTDDVMLYKAQETIRKAGEASSPAEQQTWLGDSLRLFTKGARVLPFENIRDICGNYQRLNYAQGAIELPLSCAHALDPDNIGFEYWDAGCPPNDRRFEYYQRRLQCYTLVLDFLAAFEGAGKIKSESSMVDGHEAVRHHAYELAFASKDEAFHSTMYDWLDKRGLADELLEMRPPYLAAHLKREPITMQKYQLLWKFYVKDGQPLRAAEVLTILAESNNSDLSLGRRLEYLTLAVGNAKSHPISYEGRHENAVAFLTDLEDKLDVAKVQFELYNVLLPRTNDEGVGDKVKCLSERLLNISELYHLYAEPFDLPVIKLLILHVSEHQDENIVNPIWSKIFEDALQADSDVQGNADRVLATIVPLGQRFHPSQSAFPLSELLKQVTVALSNSMLLCEHLGHISKLIVQFFLVRRGDLPTGWAARVLVQCGVPYSEIWDVLHEMYESHIPPFNDQVNVQAINSNIAILLSDWLEEAKRSQTSIAQMEIPVGRIDLAIDQYLAELDSRQIETKNIYESIRRHLRRNW
ncbi:hypothetical protein SERLA73DRAFT_164639 [Serpula lacrymans var. lacrymans S7.3]|uniref:Nucleoporin n=2 Tax=Serpula lacrymans var. lacrymans TaxID=341189 RepID=F8PFW8_SERL3|nr:uncharacterized protein SERLADRAFT_444392 [Serpula lacrymans var. lacrymans S7.9]EGO04780.1 hypothetical protein SERLA73DRAFT_164639 [Serpula lacrymans var. lacrymans S7.3]EGO30616.1 hypothetical protein SERLADRAFT_444392 [Serpula lacrymans var. lacrymans S7.9]